MGIGALAVVADWLDAVNDGDADRVARLSAEDVEVAGPRGTARGRAVLAGWLTRAGFAAQPRRWFCGADGTVVVEQAARWIDPATGTDRGAAVVASEFHVGTSQIQRYARHDDLGTALANAGLHESDEVHARH